MDIKSTKSISNRMAFWLPNFSYYQRHAEVKDHLQCYTIVTIVSRWVPEALTHSARCDNPLTCKKKKVKLNNIKISLPARSHDLEWLQLTYKFKVARHKRERVGIFTRVILELSRIIAASYGDCIFYFIYIFLINSVTEIIILTQKVRSQKITYFFNYNE